MSRRGLLLAVLVGLTTGIIVASCSGPNDPEPVGPAAVVSIDTVSTRLGRLVHVPIRLTLAEDATERLDSLGGFRFVIDFDTSAMIFQKVIGRGDAVSNWEYFTWRTQRFHPGENYPITIESIRDMNNGVEPDPEQSFPEGVIATIEFWVSNELRLAGSTVPLTFIDRECPVNYIYPLAAPEHRYVQFELNPGELAHCDSQEVFDPMLQLNGGAVRFLPPPDERPDSLVIEWPHLDSTIITIIHWPGTDSQTVTGYWPW